MSRFLFYFKCRHCATWAVTAADTGKYVQCNGCGGAKKYEYREPVASDEDAKTYHMARERGVLHLPIVTIAERRCVRCGERKTLTRRRVDGEVCQECYRAEEHPPLPVKPLTREEHEAHRQRMRDQEQAMYARQDAAISSSTGE